MNIVFWIELIGLVICGILFIWTFRKPNDSVEKIHKALAKGKNVEISLEEIGKLSWLRYMSTPQTAQTPTPEPSPTPEPVQEKPVQPSPEALAESQSQKIADSLNQIKDKLSEKSRAFFNEVVVPLVPILEREGSLKYVMKILIFLSEHGKIPSVPSPYLDSTSEPLSFRELKTITLEEHSLNVAREGMMLLKKELPHMIEISPGKYLVIFLGHDLGKAYAGKNYSSGDHPVLSANILNEFIPDEIPWKASAIRVVKSHHLDGNPFEKGSLEALDLDLLRKADRAARENEIRKVDLASVRPLSEEKEKLSSTKTDETVRLPAPGVTRVYAQELKNKWIMPYGVSPEELFSCIRPWVNRVITSSDLSDPSSPIPPDTPEGNFLAVSQPNGIVYVRPDLIYHGLLKLIKEKKVIKQNASLLAMPKNEALPHIVAWLMKNGCIVPGHVKEGYMGRYYIMKLGDKEHRILFTPVPAEVFGVLPGELEKERKQNPRVCDVHEIRKDFGSGGEKQ